MKRKHFIQVNQLRLLPAIKMVLIALFLIGNVPLAISQNAPYPLKPLDAKRIAEIKNMLSEQPKGFGDPISKRETWDKLLKSGKYERFLRGMKNYAFPPFSKKDYFSLSNGTETSSGAGLTMMRKRAEGLSKVTWAECLENKDRYTAQVEAGLRDIINQKSWVSPRSDHGFKNYNGVAYSVELTSSLYAHTIAQTLYMMGDKISSKLRTEAINALYLKIFNPVLEKIRAQNKENSFLTETNNWNHVCLAGLVGAALATIDNKDERATFVAIGEYYSKNGLSGFGEDGYCGEGIIYYNYGFGHYAMLRESIWQATGGKVDLFSDPKVQKIARYVPNLEIINNVYPAFSDCREGATPDTELMSYLSRSLKLGLIRYDTLSITGKTSDNRRTLMMAFPNSSTSLKPGKTDRKDASSLRFFFDHTGVLVCRPAAGSSSNMGVVLKGGNNNESHNHNDIGSYTVVQGNQTMAGDPGVIPYTANIFDPKYRYTYKTISSFGHPVPLIADSTQRPGAQARSKTTHSNFTPEKDEVTLDISSAYNVPGLKKLERTMVYNRQGSGSVTFEDVFEYTEAKKFETAVVTRSVWKQVSDSTLLLTRNDQKMLVTFSSPGNKLSLRSEEITEGGPVYARIGIFIDKPVVAGRMIITYKPQN
ncbi:heparinase II/III family protein [Pedobacter heparinus]|uniref:Heparinase II/III family protein n=1 Tax=Pedobacter heparinus (strain ATCC 13125 / DSM 2366 / CIP 104194 / JCM 7457 / NBRC 12017 / NCIMB 9290 / NRRL B-14731 / HIM 762-3) TaxID=485917 RepID=C6XVS7_PEDHD|nr:heparinase II/III family protein [Pedobacter heparinus]ACU06152.1 hypothetical protein Phep_3961 [Pedobacter heparinus DSM 2366]